MFNYRNGFWLLVACILIYGFWSYSQSLPSTPSTTESKVLLVTSGPGPYWEAVQAGAEAAAKELNVNVEVRMPKQRESLEGQMQILSTLTPSDWEGIAISPLDAEQQTRLINQLARETKVLTFDSDAPLANTLGYVGTSNYGAGKLAAELVHQALPEGGKIAVMMANNTKANLLNRKNGFEENIHRLLPGDTAGALGEYTIVDYLVDEGNDERAAELVRQVFQDHPDLACIVAMNAQHGPILMRLREELDKLGEVALITFDHDEATLQGISDGHIFATIAQDP